MMATSRRGVMGCVARPLEWELDGFATKVSLKVTGHIHMWRLSSGILYDQKQFGYNLDDVACLEDEISLSSLDTLGR